MKLRVAHRAGSQIAAIVDFIAADNPRASHRVLSAIERSFVLLQDFPEIGRLGRNGVSREWVVRGAPCVVIYDVDQNRREVLIQSVYHSAQDRPRG